MAALAISTTALLLAGCTGGEPEPDAKTKRTRVTDAPTTPEQWWDVAKQQKAEWELWTEGWETVGCGSLDELESASIDCSLLVYSAVDIASMAEQTWTGMTTPGAGQFISTEPPAEIADLVTSTQEAATKAAGSAAAWMEADCGIEMTGDCPALTTTLGDDLTAYDAQLAAWDAQLAEQQ